MDWLQVSTIVGANLGMFLWATRQSRTDFLHVMRVIDEIKKETKDFHGKLERQDADFKSHLKYANHGTREGDK